MITPLGASVTFTSMKNSELHGTGRREYNSGGGLDARSSHVIQRGTGTPGVRPLLAFDIAFSARLCGLCLTRKNVKSVFLIER